MYTMVDEFVEFPPPDDVDDAVVVVVVVLKNCIKKNLNESAKVASVAGPCVDMEILYIIIIYSQSSTK